MLNCFIALSINPEVLQSKLIDSLYSNFSEEDIDESNFIVVCQGYSDELINELRSKYSEIDFIQLDRIKDKSISEIRMIIYNHLIDLKKLDDYDFITLIDDDFKFWEKSLDQYYFQLLEAKANPMIGMVGFHQHIKKDYRELQESIYNTDASYLGAISMRNGLSIRSILFNPQSLFNSSIYYHEEMYIATKIYEKGYDIYRGWTNVYHRSSKSGLGKTIANDMNVANCNTDGTPRYSAKAYLAEVEGLVELIPGAKLYYEGTQDTIQATSRLMNLHKENREVLINGL